MRPSRARRTSIRQGLLLKIPRPFRGERVDEIERSRAWRYHQDVMRCEVDGVAVPAAQKLNVFEVNVVIPDARFGDNFQGTT